jgi:hypothetical protein
MVHSYVKILERGMSLFIIILIIFIFIFIIIIIIFITNFELQFLLNF